MKRLPILGVLAAAILTIAALVTYPAIGGTAYRLDMALDFMADRYIAEREPLARIFSDFHGLDMLDDRLGEIHVPVLVVWGGKDRLLHPSAADRWASGIAGARTVVYPELGHMPMVEDPARTAGDVLAFVESVP